jgi:hypothetical protein
VTQFFQGITGIGDELPYKHLWDRSTYNSSKSGICYRIPTLQMQTSCCDQGNSSGYVVTKVGSLLSSTAFCGRPTPSDPFFQGFQSSPKLCVHLSAQTLQLQEGPFLSWFLHRNNKTSPWTSVLSYSVSGGQTPESPPSREKKAMGPGSSQGLHLTQLSYKAVAAHRWVSGGRDRTKQDLGMFPEHSAMWCFTLQNLLSICMT